MSEIPGVYILQAINVKSKHVKEINMAASNIFPTILEFK